MGAKVIHIYNDDGDKIAEKGVCDCPPLVTLWEVVLGVGLALVVGLVLAGV